MSVPRPRLALACLAVVVLCAAANILALTSALYTLQVYDRVLASRSVPTLLALSVLAAGLYLALGLIDAIRSQIMVRIADRLDQRLMGAAHAASLRLPSLGVSSAQASQPVRDCDVIRGFVAGPAPISLLDLPWVPLYFLLIYVLSPPLAWAAACGLAILVVVTIAAELATARADSTAQRAQIERNAFAEAAVRNAASVKAMGMAGNATDRFLLSHDALVEAQARANEAIGSYSALSRTVRILLQSAIVGLGGYLAIFGEMSGGAIIAASIAAGRALAPVEQVIGNWKGYVQARRAWSRLRAALALAGSPGAPLKLPAPRANLALEGVSAVAPGTRRTVLADISLEVPAGSVLGVVGLSAAGKSCLARVMVGVWPAVRGAVRLDGAALDRWSPTELGRHIGYLPQEVELFPGTIADNIARLAASPDPAAVIKAAQAAGVHDMIVRLPNGYETLIESEGTALSGGQRQRIALARALYGEPFLVVLDEPNANLDVDGEMALRVAIDGVRARGGIVVVIAHRNGILASADLVATLENGRLVTVADRRRPASGDGGRVATVRRLVREPAARSAS